MPDELDRADMQQQKMLDDGIANRVQCKERE